MAEEQEKDLATRRAENTAAVMKKVAADLKAVQKARAKEKLKEAKELGRKRPTRRNVDDSQADLQLCNLLAQGWKMKDAKAHLRKFRN